MPVEIKNLSIKVQISSSPKETRPSVAEERQTWKQRELLGLIEKSLNNKKER